MKALVALAVILLSCAAALAAQMGLITATTSSTIAVTNTFQTVLAYSIGRQNCAVQNQGTHTMYVNLGALGSATTANSIQLAANGIFYCAMNGSNITAIDTINLTGTAGDAYAVLSQ